MLRLENILINKFVRDVDSMPKNIYSRKNFIRSINCIYKNTRFYTVHCHKEVY